MAVPTNKSFLLFFVSEMAREYISDPRGKRHIWHEPKTINQAMFYIQKGNSIRSVAKTTGKPYSLLQRYYKNTRLTIMWK